MNKELDLNYIEQNIENLKTKKWLLVSSLQKAVRRGLSYEAGNLWEISKQIDKFYTCYRASIMAIEDIGLGNPLLVHDFLSTSLKKKNLLEKGGDDYIKKVIMQLAQSKKDRTACDITWLAGKITPLNVEENFLIKEYKSEHTDIINRVLNGWLMTGTKKIKHSLINEKDNISEIDNFIQINRELGVDEKILEVVSASYGYHKEPHIFAYPLLSLILKNESENSISHYKTGDVFEKKIETPIYYHYGIPILYSAIDGHTSEGKRVLEKIQQQHTIQKVIGKTTPEIQSYLLKHALFKAEGQVVDKRLFYPTASVIYKKSQQFYQDKQMIKDLINEVENMLPEIHTIRENILNYTFKKQYQPKY